MFLECIFKRTPGDAVAEALGVPREGTFAGYARRFGLKMAWIPEEREIRNHVIAQHTREQLRLMEARQQMIVSLNRHIELGLITSNEARTMCLPGLRIPQGLP